MRIAQFLKAASPPTIIGGGIAYSYWGEVPRQVAPLDSLLSQIEVWLYREFNFPVLFVFFVGLGVAYLGWLGAKYILRSAERKEALAEFRERLQQLGDTRNTWFSILRIAYAGYRERILEANMALFGRLDPDLNLFLDACSYPMWLDGKSNDVVATAHSILSETMDPAWNFAHQLYSEIHFGNTGDFASLLNDEQRTAFHRVRRDLVNFWDEVGEKVRGRLLSAKQIDGNLKEARRLLKFLPILQVTLMNMLHEHHPGSRHLFWLAHRSFKRWEK